MFGVPPNGEITYAHRAALLYIARSEERLAAWCAYVLSKSKLKWGVLGAEEILMIESALSWCAGEKVSLVLDSGIAAGRSIGVVCQHRGLEVFVVIALPILETAAHREALRLMLAPHQYADLKPVLRGVMSSVISIAPRALTAPELAFLLQALLHRLADPAGVSMWNTLMQEVSAW